MSSSRKWVVLAGIGLAAAGCFRSGPQQQQEPAAVRGPAFTDVTAAAGLGDFRHERGAFGRMWMPETFGAGGGFVDYDGDGWADVLLVGGGVWPGHGTPVPALELYRNDRDGTFTRVTEETGLAGVRAHGFGFAAADYDNDGDQDIYLTTVFENLLFRNDAGPGGGRVFTEVGRAAGVAGEPTWSTAALFFDADRDGHVDLYVGNYVPWTPETDRFCTSDGQTKDYCTPHQYEGVPNRFFHNNGDGTFTDWTGRVDVGRGAGKTLGVAEMDFDNDGWPDVVVANDTQRNLVYHNDGDGTFTEIGVASGVAFDPNGRARAGMGVDAGVVDETGETSIFVGNFSDEMVGVWRHAGGRLFADRSAASGIGMSTLRVLTFGVLLVDVDLDGDLDFLAANGHIIEHVDRMEAGISYRQPAQLFLNDGRGGFTPATNVAGGVFDKPLVARALAAADIDHDGDLDLLLTENGGPAHLWRNDLDPQARDGLHFLRVRLEGRQSNRDALGSRVVVVAGGRRQERRVRTGSSYLAQSETTVSFGLGASAVVDTLRVEWPGGHVDVFTGVAADRELHLVEGQPAPGLTAAAASPAP